MFIKTLLTSLVALIGVVFILASVPFLGFTQAELKNTVFVSFDLVDEGVSDYENKHVIKFDAGTAKFYKIISSQFVEESNISWEILDNGKLQMTFTLDGGSKTCLFEKIEDDGNGFEVANSCDDEPVGSHFHWIKPKTINISDLTATNPSFKNDGTVTMSFNGSEQISSYEIKEDKSISIDLGGENMAHKAIYLLRGTISSGKLLSLLYLREGLFELDIIKTDGDNWTTLAGFTTLKDI